MATQPAELQIHPSELLFSAHVGQDAPLRCTLFNPHPVHRLAFKVSARSHQSVPASRLLDHLPASVRVQEVHGALRGRADQDDGIQHLQSVA